MRNIPKRRDLSKLQSDSPAPTPAEAAVVMTTTAAPQAPAPAPPARQLPIPRLQVGDFTYLNISNGSESQNVANTWAPCSVAGLGSHEHMYNVFFIYAPEGLRQSKDVPAQLLRKVDGRRYAEAIQYYREDAEATGQLAAWVRKRLEAVKAAKDGIVANATTKEDKEKEVYQPGDFMEIRLETDLVGPSSNLSWVPCRLVGNGTRLNSYQVHFLFAPPGHGDITNITRAYLRKIPSLDFAKRSLALKKDLELARQAVEQLAQEASNRRELEEQELKKELLAQQAAERLAQREQEKAKKLAKAKAAAEMKEEEKKARKERELAKKAEEEKEAKRIAQYSFSNGAAVLLKLDKPFDGESNLPGKVVRRGSAELNTYDLHFQWSPEGQQDLTGIPAAYLRPADADEFADLIGKFSGDPVAAQVVFAQASKEAARHLRALAAERRARAAEAAGESAS